MPYCLIKIENKFKITFWIVYRTKLNQWTDFKKKVLKEGKKYSKIGWNHIRWTISNGLWKLNQSSIRLKEKSNQWWKLQNNTELDHKQNGNKDKLNRQTKWNSFLQNIILFLIANITHKDLTKVNFKIQYLINLNWNSFWKREKVSSRS